MKEQQMQQQKLLTAQVDVHDIVDGVVQESPLIRTKKGPSPTC